MSVLSSFDGWKKFLGDRVEAAHKAGMNDDTIANLAYEIGEFLDERVDPKNDEQRVLKELWDVGNEQERHVMAKLMVKLAKHNQ
ncbi:DUF3243 domain-containing protein [Paenibacillus gansuensis]|uniref:DUF3243 domain-containing protein n=1 Tax=Paenibacillus gansuensis TaxID=306542 RepID=A0ABW5PEY3_9BACL